MEKYHYLNWSWLISICYAIVYIAYHVYLLKKNKITESSLSYSYTLRKLYLILFIILFVIFAILSFFYDKSVESFGEWMISIINSSAFFLCLILANEVVLFLQKRHLKKNKK